MLRTNIRQSSRLALYRWPLRRGQHISNLLEGLKYGFLDRNCKARVMALAAESTEKYNLEEAAEASNHLLILQGLKML